MRRRRSGPRPLVPARSLRVRSDSRVTRPALGCFRPAKLARHVLQASAFCEGEVQRACQTLPAPASLSSGFFRPFLFLTDFVPGPDWKQPSGPCPWQGPSPVLPLLPSLASWERGPFAGVSLSAVSAARGRSRPQKIEWKSPEINNSSVVNCMPFCMV